MTYVKESLLARGLGSQTDWTKSDMSKRVESQRESQLLARIQLDSICDRLVINPVIIAIASFDEGIFNIRYRKIT